MMILEDAIVEDIVARLGNLYAAPAITLKYMEWYLTIQRQEQRTSRFSLGCPRPQGSEQDPVPAEVERVIQSVSNMPVRFFHVESQYYDWSLEKRALRLRAPSLRHLCKTILFENTRCTENDMKDPLNSRYYSVLVQYSTKINTQKLNAFVRALKGDSISKKRYNLRVADETECATMTGFKFNGVSPFGSQTVFPVLISKSLMELQPPIAYFGAGHPDWKLCVPVDTLQHSLQALVADIIE